jgi:RNA polymerase sigma-70 factor (ECF subfamily)
VVDCTGQTDEEVIQRVISERDYFACIVDRYEQKLLRYIKRLMPGIQEDAEDVLQEIFIKTYINIRGFDPELKFSSWVYRIAHNEAVTWLRKKKARPETIELGDEDFQTFTESSEIAVYTKEHVLSKDAVGRVLALVTEKYRTVLVLRFLEGKSYEEISDILTVPPGTVATLIFRAKKEFSNIYEKHHD